MDATATLAIDPGDHGAGLAVWTRDPGDRWILRASAAARKPTIGHTTPSGAAMSLRALLRDAAIAVSAHVWWVVIESHTNPHISRASIDSLAASRRTWEQTADLVLHEHTTYFLPAQTWQSGCGIATPKARGSMGDTKAAAMILASEIMRPLRPATHDEADAVVMGDWWLRAGGPRVQEELAARRKAKRAKHGGWRDPSCIDALRAKGYVV